MRIKCPECREVLDLGSPKPGRYRPRCKRCGKTFQLKIGSESPPKIAIGRDKPAAETSKPNAAKQHAGGDKKIVRSASDPAIATAPNRSVDMTIESAWNDQTRASIADETHVPEKAGVPALRPVPESTPVVSRDESVEEGGGEMPARLGGYRLIRMLGRGAMGAVYEAKQVSLDRLVALKTIRERLANNPSALVRFTREAYSAAQLNHHNIVQIYDFGEEDGQHFFSMERVNGVALDEVVRKHGPLEARLAVTYVLQAARGLQHAHANAMVHRDIKPANLLLSHDGVVKVADLGLVKVPDQQDLADADDEIPISRASGTQVTMMGTAVGTPAYMAPEQALDAKSVDHRADIYSLGCTLYFLLTGRPPFAASQVSELLAQHASDPIPSVGASNRHVPASVDSIIERAMAKSPNMRYPSLTPMIAEMESFLGMKSGSLFAPSVARANEWTSNAEQFHKATPMANLRPPAVFALAVFCAVLLFITPWIGLTYVLMGPVCLVTAVAVSLTLQSLLGENSLVAALRAWCGTWGIVDYVYAVGVLVLFGCVALFAGGWQGIIAGGLLGAIAGAAYHFGLHVPTIAGRQASLAAAEKMIRDFRISGADEDGVRMFVARYSGKRWGELFAAIFGVDALLAIRDRALQDSVIPECRLSQSQRWIARLRERTKTNRRAMDQAKLSRVEHNALVSEGLSESEARDRAWQIAAALMEATRTPASPGGGANPAAIQQAAADQAAAKRQRIRAMLADARSGRYRKKRDPLQPLKTLLGPPLRLVAGVAVLALLAITAHQAGWLEREKLTTVATSLQQADVTLDNVSETLRANIVGEGETDTASQQPQVLGTNIVSLAIAGLLLLGSAFVSGWRMTPFAFVAVAVVLWGSRLGIPAVDPTPAYLVAAIVGAALMVPGAVLSEREGGAEI